MSFGYAKFLKSVHFGNHCPRGTTAYPRSGKSLCLEQIEFVLGNSMGVEELLQSFQRSHFVSHGIRSIDELNFLSVVGEDVQAAFAAVGASVDGAGTVSYRHGRRE